MLDPQSYMHSLPEYQGKPRVGTLQALAFVIVFSQIAAQTTTPSAILCK